MTRSWDAKQVATVHAIGEQMPLAASWRLVLLTGMRGREFLGLTWDDTASRPQYEKLIKAAEVSSIRFHDSRHTSAALPLAQAIPPKLVQERMGHANIGMTLNL